MKKYYFTFGWGQPHQNCYHVIEAANGVDARMKMIERFGQEWAMLYESAEAAGVEEYGLQELKCRTTQRLPHQLRGKGNMPRQTGRDEVVYPMIVTEKGGWLTWHPGMTKREEFAKAAMQGLLANPQAQAVYAEGFSDLMKTAVAAADALIAALNEPTEPKP